MTENVVMEVGRVDHGSTRLVESELGELGDGRVRVRVDAFALTANNITYAAVGDMLGYWDFFPTGDPAWGRVPAMGWAEVVESNVAGIDVGGRYYGWWPMARYVDFTATPTDEGFRDDGDHRVAHSPVYRSYTEQSRDWMMAGVDASADEVEERHALLRGLFMTGYLIDAFAADLAGEPVEQLVLLSASSKTAIATAWCAKARDGGPLAVGVTSAGNVDFVQGLGCYDEVVTYDDIGSLPEASSVVVDMSGAGVVVAAVHEHLGDLIESSLIVGRSHHDAPSAVVTSGPGQEFFFAPTEVERRVAEWGTDGYRERVAGALAAFIDASRQWLTVERRSGADAVEDTWADTYAGKVGPHTGLVIAPSE